MPRIVLHEKTPIIKDALSAALEHHGFEVVSPTNTLEWLRVNSGAVLLTQLCDQSDWPIIVSATSVGHGRVIVLIEEAYSMDAQIDLAALGVHSILPRQTPLEVLVSAIQLSLHGFSVLRDEVLSEMSPSPALRQRVAALDDEEKKLLSDVSTTETIASVARGRAESERGVYRRLHRLYAKLGVGGRLEAAAVGLLSGLRRHEGSTYDE